MNIGNLLIYLAFVLSGGVLYAVARRLSEKIIRLLANLSFASILVASAILMYYIVSHDYSIAYVFESSSNEMPFHLLLATFFAGQEGAILFWNLALACCGLMIANSKNTRRDILAVFAAVQLLFILLVMVKSPFMSLAQKYPDYFDFGSIPLDGRGMNPLLESIWMVIHPPILFVGYAILTVPSVFGFASLCSKCEIDWIAKAHNWQLLGLAVLGIGIALGGVWAYQSLGWGGFWGWDPVENVSLIPWIIAVITLHGFILQRKYGQCKYLNYMLVMLQFVSILYSALVTRTGIAENSMHTFAGESTFVFWILLTAIVAILVGGSCFLFSSRRNNGDKILFDYGINSKTLILAGMCLLAIIAVFVFVGTTLPIIANNFAVDVSYFNTINLLPLCMIIILIVVSHNLHEKFRLRIIIVALIFAVVVTFCFGIMHEIRETVLAFLSIMLAFVCVFAAIRKTAAMGAIFAHCGLGVMFLGIVLAASRSDETSLVSLLSNTTQPVGNARVGYLKSEQIASQKDREKYRFIVSVQESESMKYLYPVITVKDGQIFKEPAIYSDFLKDVYVSPLALDSVKNADGVKYGERFTFEISFKPYISLVPVGAVIILLGFFVAVKIRKKQ